MGTGVLNASGLTSAPRDIGMKGYCYAVQGQRFAGGCWDVNSALGVVLPATAEGCHDANGATVGGQVGYRWQASAWVFGLEAQGNWSSAPSPY